MEKEVILSYNDQLNFETIGILLNKLENEMKARGVKIGVYKKMLIIMVESLENIYKYTEITFENYHPKFFVEKFEDHFLLSAGNTVYNKDIDKLKNKIDKINKLDRDGLKKLYKETITDGKFSSKGGAGLGFIEMAKISGNKIDYRFEEINNELSYYFLDLRVNCK